MHKILQSYQNIMKTICEPNPKLYPDSATQKMVYQRSIINFYNGFLFCTLYALFAMFYPSSSVSLYIIWGSFWLLCSFVFLCRSYPCFFNLVFVSAAMLIGFKSLDLVREATYFYLGFIFVLLPFVMIVSKDTNLTFIAGIVQIFMCFVNLTVLFFIIQLLVNFNFLRPFNQRTLELSKAKVLSKRLWNNKSLYF